MHGCDELAKPLSVAIKRWRAPFHFPRSLSHPLFLLFSLNSKLMSSSSWSTGESENEGQGYADGAATSSSSEFSSFRSTVSLAREEAVNDDVEFNVDNSLEWTGITPPLAI